MLTKCYRKSELRKPSQPPLGPKYSGTRTSRISLLEGSGTSELNEEREEGPENTVYQGDNKAKEVFEFADPDEVHMDLDAEQGDTDEDIDSDEAFGEGDEEAFEEFTFRGSGRSRSGKIAPNRNLDIQDDENMISDDGDTRQEEKAQTNRGMSSVSEDSAYESDDAISYDRLGSDENRDDGSLSRSSVSSGVLQDQRATLRKMMATESATVAASISQATKSDIAKGRAVQYQRSTYDVLLDTRIRLQKALIATNTFLMLPSQSVKQPSTDDIASIAAAENAALNLFNSLTSLRAALPSSQRSGKETTSASPSASTVTPLTTLQATISAIDNNTLPTHRGTLTKWAQKTQPTAILTPRNKFANTSSPQSLLSILDAQLAGPGMEHLIAKTTVPRSCAPLQAQQEAGGGERKHTRVGEEEIREQSDVFDDADFYAALLRELVERKMGDSKVLQPLHNGVSKGVGNSTRSPLGDGISLHGLRKEARVKKKVDTKASKGRKIRYTVHEKLQNFMAREEKGGWGDRQVDEFFGGLLGKKIGLGEEKVSDDESAGEEGLRLFGGH